MSTTCLPTLFCRLTAGSALLRIGNAGLFPPFVHLFPALPRVRLTLRPALGRAVPHGFAFLRIRHTPGLPPLLALHDALLRIDATGFHISGTLRLHLTTLFGILGAPRNARRSDTGLHRLACAHTADEGKAGKNYINQCFHFNAPWATAIT